MTTQHYIDALKSERRGTSLAALPFEPDAILASFHGMPAADAGARRSLSLPLPEDRDACWAEALGRELTMVTFQSRFGRAKWLEPATDITLAALPA
jgi:ferrochelatase